MLSSVPSLRLLPCLLDWLAMQRVEFQDAGFDSVSLAYAAGRESVPATLDA